MEDPSSLIGFLTLFAVPFVALVVIAGGVWRQFQSRDDDIVVRLLKNSDEPMPTVTLRMTELLENAIDQDLLARLQARASRNRRSVPDEHRAILHAALSDRRGILSRLLKRRP